MLAAETLASFNTFCDLLRAAASFTRMCTFSARAICRTISAYTHGIGWKRPGQSVGLCGHAIHVAACGSHSAGMRKPWEAGVTRCRRRLAAFICFVLQRVQGVP